MRSTNIHISTSLIDYINLNRIEKDVSSVWNSFNHVNIIKCSILTRFSSVTHNHNIANAKKRQKCNEFDFMVFPNHIEHLFCLRFRYPCESIKQYDDAFALNFSKISFGYFQ